MNKLSAGTGNARVWLFRIDHAAFALYNRKIISFWELPAQLIRVFRHEMEAMPNLQRYFKIDKIGDERERLETYICTVYGKLDYNPVYKHGRTNPESDFNAASLNLGFSIHETRLLRLLAAGHTDLEISGELDITPATVGMQRHTIGQRIKARSAAVSCVSPVKRNLSDTYQTVCQKTRFDWTWFSPGNS
jgi:DNA-binding CsgD family transcriptional regulator